MMPDQAQRVGQATENSAALGIVFGKEYLDGDVKKGLERYKKVRQERAT